LTDGIDIGELLARLAAIDVRLTLDGDRLGVNAPKGALSAELRAELGAAKEAIKAHLRAHPPTPARRAVALPPLVPVPRAASMPVAHTQQRLWFLRQMDPLSSTYNIVSAFHMNGTLDVAALQRSLDDLVERHESLRTRFVAVDGAPRCSVEPHARVVLRQVDLGHLDPALRDAAAMDDVLATAREPFDLAACPLLRITLIKLTPQRHLFCFVVDHIVADGISVGIFFHELQALYAQHSSGKPAQLPPLPVQYIDHVHWQQQVLAAGALDAHLAHWKQQLRGLPPVLSLPTDRPRPRVQTFHGARLLEVFPAPLVAGLKALARREGVTLYMVLLAGFEVLMHRYSGEEDFAVGTAVGARGRPEVERVIGFFANNIVQRADLSGDPTAQELLARVREVALKAYAHQDMPFDLLVEALAPRRDLDHSPLFQVLFVVHNLMVTGGELGNVNCEVQELPLKTSRFDLSVDVFDLADGTRVYFEYNTDLFDETTIVRMMAHYRSLLAGLVAEPQARVGALPMLGADEQQGLLAQWRGPSLAPPAQATLHAFFEAQVQRSPDTQAVVFDSHAIGYAELDARANRLAQHLAALGVREESLVGVWMERSIDMVVAMLAVLKAGGAYVPLDPAFPRDRIDFMMEDAALAVVVTQSALAVGLPEGGPRAVCMDRDAALIAAMPATAPAARSGAANLAYVIYTSGSTGRPKGVQIEHAAVVNFLRSMHAEPGIAAGDRLVSVTTLSFDIAGLEIFGPLTAGATVVLASRATALDGQRLAALLDDAQAGILQATPATWRLLLDSGWTGRAGLKMLCGGEALQRELADRLLALPGALWNMYGPTETTIWSTLTQVHDTRRPIAIGRPIAETSVYVLEASGLPAPLGVAGELCIGGAGVARGYRNRPELTAEKFVTVSVAGLPPERVYRTGDLARLRSDGQLEFVGRRDHQVKLRGFRIELEEIETVLATHPGLRQNVVAVREDTPGDQRLVAYVVAADGAAFEADAARTTLRTRLPEYMVPNLFVVLDALPLTPNGKVDRKALPAPVQASTAADDGTADALMSPAQQRVAVIWRELLGVARVGLRDNFFDLGGHSLLLVKLQVRLQREFSVELPLVELFQRTTVESQTERLAATTTDDSALRRARERAARQAHV
jgi:amino acid adenylation domain-containing protein